MSARRGGRLANLLFGTAVALLAAPAGAVVATASPATAGPPAIVEQGAAVASVGQLVLEPTERGYRGSMPITVRNTGSEAGYFRLLVREPVAGSWVNAQPAQFCQPATGYTGHRLTYECFLQGIQPGAELLLHLSFRVLTTPEEYAMRATGGALAVSGSSDLSEPFSELADVTALFRSTTGSLRGPRPYMQDRLAESSIAVSGDLTLIRRADGWFAGRLRATVGYGSDAAHNWIMVETELPDGVIFTATEPAEVPCWGSCPVPGGAFMEGEQRTFDLIFEAPPDTEPGTLGQGTAKVIATWQGIPVEEADTSNNAVAFHVRAAEAA